MNPPDSAVEIGFERIRLSDVPEMIELALDNTDPRIASYAVETRAATRRARLIAWAAALPGLGERIPQPKRSYWITSDGKRAGVVLLSESAPWLHLHFVVIARELRGKGAADQALAFIEDEARKSSAKGVDLYVDRRNYRAYHLYVRHGYRLTEERRFIFDVARRSLPSMSAIASLPWHAAAEVLGAIGARGLAGRPWRGGSAPSKSPARPPFALREGGIATLSLDSANAIDGAVNDVFRTTLARVVRVSLPFAANVSGGQLVAILQRMEKVLV